MSVYDYGRMYAYACMHAHVYGRIRELVEMCISILRRYAYITPKTFIESIKLYGSMLKEKIEALKSKSDRLSSGLQKLIDTKEKVSALEDDLKEKTVVVEEKKAAADEFAQRVGEEKAKVTAESEKANLEAQTCAEIQKNVSEQRVSPPAPHSQTHCPHARRQRRKKETSRALLFS